ncbi:MAG: hypothetical protein GQ582_11900 [Methyloprofundus sp.]|nr:hypothetical protein [Methyloprofundus sp.]
MQLTKILQQIIIPALLLIAPLIVNADTPAKTTWMYSFSSLDNTSTINQLVELEINRVYLAVSAKKLLPNGEDASLYYTHKLEDFIALATAENIEIHAMTLMDNTFFLRERHARSAEMVTWLIDYQANALIDEQFSGIHIDTEPHSLTEWKSAKKLGDWETVEILMQQYVELIAILEPIIHLGDSSLEFSAALQWKYNEWAEQGLLPSGDAELLGEYLDHLVPMVYATDSLSRIQRRAEDEMSKAPTVIGIDAKSFNSYAEIIQAQQILDEQNRDNANYQGVSIYSFSTLYQKYLNEL